MKKRSVTLNGHRTSVSLEAEFWDALEALAARDGKSLAQLIAHIDVARLRRAPAPGLASALRLYALRRAREEGGAPDATVHRS